MDSRGPGQDCLPWTMETRPSLASHFSTSKQPFFYTVFLSHPKLPRFGGLREGEKGNLYFEDPIVGPLEIQVSGSRYHLFLDTADRTKATLNPYHSSHSTAILTSKNPAGLQKFVGLQHNSQSKHLAIFKSSSTTSISLHRKQE